MCRQYGVKDVIFSSTFVKNSIKLGKKSQVNGAVTEKCEENGFHLSQMAVFCRNICVKLVSIYLMKEKAFLQEI